MSIDRELSEYTSKTGRSRVLHEEAQIGRAHV